MYEHSDKHTGRGWGVAALIVGLALLANLTAFYIHTSKSSRVPTDPYYKAIDE